MPPQLEEETNMTVTAPARRSVGDKDTNATTSFPDSTHTSTQIMFTPAGAPYVVCSSSHPFVNPTAATLDLLHQNNNDSHGNSANEKSPNNITRQPLTPAQVNQHELELNLVARDKLHFVVRWIRFLDQLFLVHKWENYVYRFYQSIPLTWRRTLVFGGWKLYIRLHKLLVGRSTAIHKDQLSDEYHAITTLAYWSRFLPITPIRMRFSLSQLNVCSPNVVESKVERIDYGMTRHLKGTIPSQQKDHTTVKGLYLYSSSLSKKQEDPYVIFWLYGGAFLSGDVEGNSSSADWIGRQCSVQANCGVDVFLPEFRLAPEANFDDVLWDVSLSYRYLLQIRGVNPNKVLFLGISSGAALCVRLMQLIAEYQRGEDLLPSYLSTILEANDKSGKEDRALLHMPKAAVLFGPYVDYTIHDTNGSFHHYAKHDLVVNESVQEYGLPYLDTFIPRGYSRKEYSPVYRSCVGLPPLCVIVSEHEAVYDMTIGLVNNARSCGVPVTVALFKYLCHVFPFLWAFVPESKISMDFVVKWICEQTGSVEQ